MHDRQAFTSLHDKIPSRLRLYGNLTSLQVLLTFSRIRHVGGRLTISDVASLVWFVLWQSGEVFLSGLERIVSSPVDAKRS